MTTTQINLDDQALVAAAEILGTCTKVDTVNRALRAVVIRHKQLETISRAHTDGTYDTAPVQDEAWH